MFSFTVKVYNMKTVSPVFLRDVRGDFARVWVQRLYPFIFFCLPLFSFTGARPDDMGMIHATDARVSEDGQKAIIFHNRTDEILILGTDLKASKTTGVIRFIPFPAEPSVSLAPDQSFDVMNGLLKTHGLEFISYSKGGPQTAPAVELRFNQKMGAHDIAVIRVNDVSGFRNWVNDFFKAKNLPIKNEYPAIESIVHDYLARGMAWFVFDFVTLSEQVKFIEPVAYRFKSPLLYYPLKTSNTVGGTGDIDLFVVTSGTLGDPFEPIPSCLGIPGLQASTSSGIETRSLLPVLPEADSFFRNQRLFLQLFQYHGDYAFNNDILADPAKSAPIAIWNWGELDELVNDYFQLYEKPYYTFQSYTTPGKYFSMQLPMGWTRSVYDLMKDHHQFEIMAHLPGTEDMNYLTVTADFYRDPHKTAAGFIFQTCNPYSRIQGEDYHVEPDIKVSGMTARVLDVKTRRSPLAGTTGPVIPALKRYVIIDAPAGLSVIEYDSPAGIAKKYMSVFNDIVKSFRISAIPDPAVKSLREVNGDAYTVYEGFLRFRQEKKFEWPEYFNQVMDSRRTYGLTQVAKKTSQADLMKLQKIFSADLRELFADYKLKNGKEYLIKDKILLTDLEIISANKRKMELSGSPVSLHQISGMLFFSQPGFNKAKDKALFYVSNDGAPHTGYFVYMGKASGSWVIRDVVMWEMMVE